MEKANEQIALGYARVSSVMQNEDRQIIAMQGPFPTELNTALIRHFGIRYLVTKDGGAAGGFPEKAKAARETEIELVLLCRPEETGSDFDTVYQECITLLHGGNASNNDSCESEKEKKIP